MVKQVTTPAMSESAVLLICDKAGIMCVDTNSNLITRRWALVAKGIAEVMPQEPFHVCKSIFAERETLLLKGMIAARGTQTVVWLTTVENEWI